MRLVTYRSGQDAARLGALAGDLVVDIEMLGAAHGIELPDNMLDFIDHAATTLPAAKALVEDGDWPVGTAIYASNVKLLAPIPRPRKNVFGIGLNYKEHVAESAKTLDTSADLPKQPVVFSKPPTCIIGPGEPIHHNAKMTQQLDWEVELAVIIGKAATRTCSAWGQRWNRR